MIIRTLTKTVEYFDWDCGEYSYRRESTTPGSVNWFCRKCYSNKWDHVSNDDDLAYMPNVVYPLLIEQETKEMSGCRRQRKGSIIMLERTLTLTEEYFDWDKDNKHYYRRATINGRSEYWMSLSRVSGRMEPLQGSDGQVPALIEEYNRLLEQEALGRAEA